MLTTPNKSLDANGGGMFRKIIGPAMPEWNRAAATSRDDLQTFAIRLAKIFSTFLSGAGRIRRSYRSRRTRNEALAVRSLLVLPGIEQRAIGAVALALELIKWNESQGGGIDAVA